MGSHVATLEESGAAQQTTKKARREPHWDIGFLGVLAYIIIEYTRLPAVFPALQPFQVGKIAVAIGAVGMLLSPSIRQDNTPWTRLTKIALAAFTAATAVSILFAVEKFTAWTAFVDMLRWVVVFVLFSRVVANRWRLRVFLIVLVLLNVKLAQFQLRTYSSELAWGRSEEYLARGVGAGSTGFFANSNDFGIAMAVIWPLAGMAAFAERNKFLKLVLLGGFLVISASILFSASRGAMLGAGCAALYAWVRNPKRIVGPLLLGLLIAGGVFLLPQAHKDRVISAANFEQDQNAQTRMSLWKAGMRMFADSPLFGVGINNYRPAYAQRYSVPKGLVLVPHSIYIQGFAETGILGGIPLLVLLFAIMRVNANTARRLAKTGKAGRRQYEYYVALGLSMAMVAFMSNGAFLTVLYYPHLWILAAISLGLHTASLSSAAPVVEEKRKRRFPEVVEASGAPA